MKIGFMTLGCPNWDLDTICKRGSEYGFEGVDFRGYLGEIDITRLPESTSEVSKTYNQLRDAGLEVCGISTSLNVCVPEDRKKNLEDAKRTIDVARVFDGLNIRVFGGGELGKYTLEELAEIGCDCVS